MYIVSQKKRTKSNCKNDGKCLHTFCSDGLKRSKRMEKSMVQEKFEDTKRDISETVNERTVIQRPKQKEKRDKQ